MKPHPELKQPNVNVPAILRLINFLEKLPDRQFAMELFVDTDNRCGTVACIAGWACLLSDPSAKTWDATCALYHESPFIRHGAEFLGVDVGRALKLFWPSGNWDATRQQAITVLKHLARTGEVDWSVAEGV